MAEINLTTTLSTNKPDVIQTIIRGATANFTYIIATTLLTSLHQLTYSFGQRTQILQYKLYDYFVLSTDTTIIKTKTYYIKESDIFKKVTPLSSGSPVALGYYEIDLTETTSDKQINDHFQLISEGSTTDVILTLFSSDTVNFIIYNATEIEYAYMEVAIDVTGTATNLITIDPQPNVKIVNSLYQLSKEI